MQKQNSALTTSAYFVQGMHCASCEILIQKRIIEKTAVKTVTVSLAKETVTIKHLKNSKINLEYLNRIFKDSGYRFSVKPLLPLSSSNFRQPLLIAAVLIAGYILLSKSSLSSLVTVTDQSSLPVFFLFGLLAGLSSCAALVGGIILSLSRQWLSLYSHNDSTRKKAQPHLLFNVGRVLGYAIFGMVLGLVGNYFQLSPLFTALMVIAISVVMVLLGLQMLGVKALRNFQFRLPESITGKLINQSNFQGRFGPLIMGALTFFLPCGFTITAQALALTSGNPIQGALIMGLFALGTVPGLLAIGLSSLKFQSKPQSAKQFSMIAGFLVLFFAVSNVNSQLSVLGVSNFSDLISNPTTSQITPSVDILPPLVNGKQVIKISASASTYSPNRITLRANTPTRWEITDAGFSGCTNAIISRGLFNGQINLIRNGTAIKEFTSPQPGIYKFSCWMGMISGTVQVVDSTAPNQGGQ